MMHIHLTLLLLVFQCHITESLSHLNKDTDKNALLSFKSHVTDKNNVLSNWTSNSSHCAWFGVSCSKVGSRVQSLHLSKLGLSGTLPSDQLSNLSYLHELDLSYNAFHGQVPFEFSHLSLLKFISLASNNLSGRIPPQLSHLHQLQILDISLNNLTGEIPSAFGNLSSLNYLALARNQLHGQIPSELGYLQNLSYLQLSENFFTGDFPVSIFNISSLVFLSVTENDLSGMLPQNVGHTLPNIRNLSLATNRFEGVVPISISNASKLESLDLANNKFHGLVPLFNNMNNLSSLVLGNNLLTSTTERNSELFESLRNSRHLKVLMIHSNQLSGELPSSVANLSSNLQHFCLSKNSLTGRIPQGLGKYQNLVSLSLEMNYFTGQIPSDIGVLNKLVQLLMYQNRLSGEVPDIFGNFTQLSILGMGNNQFSGRIPSSIGKCKRLNYLDLGFNKLHGTIPREIFMLSGLTTLLFPGNSLNGSLPSEVGSMEQLQILAISDNKLSGIIPAEIGGCSTLQKFHMARNELSGSIPSAVGNLASLDTLDLSSNNLSGTIPESLEKLQYMVKLNLSFNHLEGEIPSGGFFKNISQAALQGNTKLCSHNKEIVEKLGIHRCIQVQLSGKKRKNLLPIILTVAVACSVLFIFMLCLLWRVIIRKKKRKEEKMNLSSAPLNGFPLSISYADIRVATNNFAVENLIGKGGFGYVYKGIFRFSTGEITLAVKVLDLLQRKADKSFNAECEALRSVRHRNLVKVITCCSSIDQQGDEFKAIVMQFMSRGNLDMWLYPVDEESRSSLTLLQRLNVVIDVASAMDYLHHDCEPPVVHCDLKPANVLLDEDMVSHVADFGLARLLPQNPSQNESSTLGLKGSIGYIAPEYGLGSKPSTAGDVYSFGMLLLEMLIGKKPTDEMFKEGLSLNRFVSAMDENQVLTVADPRLLSDCVCSTQSRSNDNSSDGESSISYNNGDTSRLHKAKQCIASVIRVGLSCAAQLPRDRLTIREALTKLQGIRHSLLSLQEPLPVLPVMYN